MRRALSPWSRHLPRPFEDFAREMDDLMERFFGRERGSWSEGPAFQPSTNLAETESSFEVSVDLPGVKPEDVHVELQEGQLIVTGERKEEQQTRDKNFLMVERRVGQFRRAVTLPSGVDEDQIEAAYKDGVLTIRLPKSEAVRPKKIEVRS